MKQLFVNFKGNDGFDQQYYASINSIMRFNKLMICEH